MKSLAAVLLDPRQLAALGPTDEELLADLMWPGSAAWRPRVQGPGS